MPRVRLAFALVLAGGAALAQPPAPSFPGEGAADTAEPERAAGRGADERVADDETSGSPGTRAETVRRLLERRRGGRAAPDGGPLGTGAPAAPEPPDAGPDAASAGDPLTDPIGEPSDEPSATEVALRERRVLAARGETSLDLSLVYDRRDRATLAAVDEAAVLAELEVETVALGLLGRYALSRRLELSASVLAGETRTALHGGERRLAYASRALAPVLGLGARYALIEEGPSRPDALLDLDARIPTEGDAIASAALGIALVKTVDPLVLYGAARYRHSRGGTADEATTLAPRHALELTLGHTFAVNDSVALGTTLALAASAADRVDGVRLRARRDARLALGVTARVARALYLQPTLTLPLGGPDDAYALELNVAFEPGDR